MNMPAPLEAEHLAALARVAHEWLFTIKVDGRWRVAEQYLQQRIETLGGRGLLTTDLAVTGLRRWRLTPYGATVHRADCRACRNQTDRRAA